MRGLHAIAAHRELTRNEKACLAYLASVGSPVRLYETPKRKLLRAQGYLMGWQRPEWTEVNIYNYFWEEQTIQDWAARYVEGSVPIIRG